MVQEDSDPQFSREPQGNHFLRVVPYSRGFHFFKSIGNYTGETATSLFSLVEMLKVVDLESVEFHFRRRDFARWVREVIGDDALAERLNGVSAGLPSEDLRRALVKTVQARIRELQ